jgi:hypothetical protein
MSKDHDILQNFSKALIDNLNGTFSLRVAGSGSIETDPLSFHLNGDNSPLFLDVPNNNIGIKKNYGSIGVSAGLSSSEDVWTDSVYLSGDTLQYRLVAYGLVYGQLIYSSAYVDGNQVVISVGGDGNSVTQTWSPVSGASGYILIRSLNGSGYTDWIDVGNTTAYQDDSLGWNDSPVPNSPTTSTITDYFNYLGSGTLYLAYGTGSIFTNFGDISTVSGNIVTGIGDLTASNGNVNLTGDLKFNGGYAVGGMSITHSGNYYMLYMGQTGYWGSGNSTQFNFGNGGGSLGTNPGLSMYDYANSATFQVGGARSYGKYLGGTVRVDNTGVGLWGGTSAVLLVDATTSAFTGNVGFGIASPTAKIHLAAGSATAGTAPIKLTSGTLTTATVVGQVEFLTDALYFTITTGAVRKTLAFTDSAISSSTYIGTTSVALNRASAALTLAGITLTTPDIGTPSAGDLTNCSGTAANLTAGNASTVPTTNSSTFSLNGIMGVAYARYNFGVDNGAQGTKTVTVNTTVPAGATFTWGTVRVKTACTSGGSATVAIGFNGTGGSNTTLLGATAVATLAANYVATTVPKTSAPVHVTGSGQITFTIATADLTAGVIEVWQWYLKDRGNYG